MDFKQRKLPKEAVEQLRICPIRTLQPYALMMAPAYVYMKLNEKFVMMKGPFDFFTEEELERVKSFESLFFPEEVDMAIRFRNVANDVRELLGWNPETVVLHQLKEKTQGQKEEIPLMLSSFELSDAIIRVIGPLWRPGPYIDPYFVSVFVNELCELITPELLKSYRDQSIVDFEKAIMSSSWAVFIALHLGYTDLSFLNRLRLSVIHETMSGQSANLTSPWKNPEIHQMIQVARNSLGKDLEPLPGSLIHYNVLQTHFNIASEKLSSRMRRVERLAHV
jgi:hypothetical protein